MLPLPRRDCRGVSYNSLELMQIQTLSLNLPPGLGIPLALDNNAGPEMRKDSFSGLDLIEGPL